MKTNILIVDDVLTSLAVMSDIVKSAGFIARPVQNVKQAMEAIEAMPPDLILSDISMPDIDGYEFCGMLKANPDDYEITEFVKSKSEDNGDSCHFCIGYGRCKFQKKGV